MDGLLSPAMILLSFSATLRTILVLLVLWWVLRMFMRGARARSGATTNEPPRPQGDVRIERAPRKGERDSGVIDADFEAIK